MAKEKLGTAGEKHKKKASANPLKTNHEIERWLVRNVSERLKIKKDKIDIREPLYNYGLDSAEAVMITGELGEWLGRDVSPTMIWDCPTIERIARFLTGIADEPVVKHASVQEHAGEPIAIIGMGCRFPGAKGPQAFWQLLQNGVDAISEAPPGYRRAKGDVGQSHTADEKYGWGGFLETIDEFDAQFFGISPREAAGMDPQQRLLLEVAWEALEDAGQVPERLAGQPVGVFVGISGYEYGTLLNKFTTPDIYTATGNALSIAANRISYLLNFQGPSLSIDTACSSSLVAVHLACQSLQNGESTLALAGGVNLLLSPELTAAFTKAGMLAPDGRCKTFSAEANGYVRGEGAGVVVLKPLSKALEDGDPIYALIPGSAVNQDGRSNGLTAPNGRAQEEVLLEAYRRAGVSPGQIQYVEAHGTGTSLGDPIEVKALGNVLAIDRNPQYPCLLGSAKTNIGHLEAAAGIAGIIKVALSMKHGQIPASLHFNNPNPYISFAELPLRVQTEPGPWPDSSVPALAGVSSFGFGGTNAHVVLQSFPSASLKKMNMADCLPKTAHLLPISAVDEEALKELVQSYRDYLGGEGNTVSITDICYTAGVRRSHHDHRLAVVARSKKEMADHLARYLKGELISGLLCGRKNNGASPGLVFVFSGQGPQWWAMGRELFYEEPIFRETIEECDALFRQHADWSLITELTAEESKSRLDQTQFVQPALFAVQVALARLWMLWGIQPEAVVGHSMGEAAAAYIAGALSLTDAVRVIFHRSRLMQRTTGQGKTVAVELSWEEAESLLSGYENKVSVAAYNSATSLVLSGEPASIEKVMAELERRNVFCKLLPVSYAFHSPQMEPLKGELADSLQGLKPQSAVIPIYSTVTGQIVDGQELDAGYWANNLREPVQLAKAVERLKDDNYHVFLEVSPHPVLSGAVRQNVSKRGQDAVVLPSLRRQEPERAAMLNSLGSLYTLGYSVNWEQLQQGGKCAALPAYPWQRESYWFEVEEGSYIYQMAQPAAAKELDQWLYELEWQPKPAGLQNRREFATRGQGIWLIFAHRSGIGELAARRLAEQGERTAVIYPGQSFACLADNVFCMSSSRQDMSRLLQQVLHSGRDFCRGIVHTWSTGADSKDEVTTADLEQAQTLGCLHVLQLVQAVRECSGMFNQAWPRLWLVTRGSQPVLKKQEPVDFTQAPLWGLGRTIALEQQELWGGLVDLDAAAPDEQAAHMLVEDMFAQDGEDQIAYRQGTRYVVRLKRHIPSHDQDISFYCYTNGSYLITGGLGDLGMQVARWLVEQGAKWLILMGRTKLPPRAAWGQTLAKGDRLACQIANIKELEAMGASVHLAPVDVSDEQQLKTFLEGYREEGWPPIRGVVHAAGTVADALLTECDPAAFNEVLRPKVQGAWHLHNLLHDDPLDFFILFSSISTLLSSPRLGSYAAANSFLDALAHQRRHLALPALSINWGPWAEIGMAARSQKLSANNGTGMNPIAPEQGLQMLEKLVGRDLDQIAVMDVDWGLWRMVYQQAGKAALFGDLLQEECEIAATAADAVIGEGSIHAELMAATQEERRQLLEQYLCEQAAQVLKLSKSRIDVHSPLNSLGFDSIMAVELKNRIERMLGVIVPMVNFLQGPSIAELTAQIQDLLTLEPAVSVIPTVPEQAYYPVSSAQKRMFILNQFEANDTAYNNFLAFQIVGTMDKQRFAEVLHKLVQRHETLRTSVEVIDGEPVQRVHQEIDFKIDECKSDEANIPDIIKAFIRPFDLSKAPLFRVGVIELAENSYVVLFDFHHIISDGVTAAIFTQELATLYEGRELSELRIQYKDFSVWQHKMFQTAEFKKQEAYWLQAFAGELPVLNMPTDYPRPSVRSFRGDLLRFTLSEELTAALDKLAVDTGATLYMVLLAAYNVLLAKYTGQEDLVIGSPIEGRPYADLHNIIGVFVNTLAMRNYPEGKKSFREFLQEVKQHALQAYQHQDYQFEELVEKLDIPRNLSRNPLFDTMFALQNVDMAVLAIGDLRLSRYDFDNKIAKFDLTLEAIERNNRLDFTLEYDTALFKSETAHRLYRHFVNVLESIVAEPQIKLAEINMISADENKQLLVDFNNTETAYPKDRTIQELFEEQAEKNPEHSAVIFNGQRLSYRELNNKANQLAGVLRAKGVTANSIVGIMVERSPEMIIGIMGILKAGGAYLPIDPEYPAERISYMLADSGTGILVTQQHLAAAGIFNGDIIDIDDPGLYQGDCSNLASTNTARDLAYVIYTSGSTGKPKGNLTMHYNVARVVKSTNYIEITDQDVLMQLSNYAFDGSVFDIYGALLNGAKLVLVDRASVLDVSRLPRIIEQEKVTVFFITTALFNTLVDVNIACFRNIRKVLFGGEMVSVSHVRKAFNYLGSGKIVHVYGPTETTVFATAYAVNQLAEGELSVPIGAPIANTAIYIVGKAGELQPVGVPGELCIAGDGLAQGYLNRPELTAEKFVANPFATGERMYRTGDLARWLPDGNIEFLGRIDHQVKIRGFRIELGEIEAELLKHPEIKETIVIAKDDTTANKYLCAYFVAGQALAVVSLREHLAQALPDYMIPSTFVQLEKMPLTPNGKVDRKALPEPDGSSSARAEYVAPRNAVEEKMAHIWQDILGVEKVGIEDNFFELGGHSLKAITLAARIHKEFAAEVLLQEIFKAQNIKELTKIVEGAAQNSYTAIETVAEQAYYPVSSAQKRMFILNQFEDNATAYNMPAVMKLEGYLDKKKFAEALHKLVERHETLRTSFEVIAGDPVQRVHRDVDFTINYRQAAEQTLPDIIETFIRPFELSEAPLLRVGVVELDANNHVLLFDMHHIISDGASIGILVKELADLYEDRELPELRIQYKDFSAWQKALQQTEGMKKHEEYWLKALAGELSVLNVPADYPRPSVRSFAGDRLQFALGEEWTGKLNKLAGQTGTTPYMVLLAAYNVLLAKYTGQEDIIVGSPITGRPHADLENIVGMFVNTLAMRNYPAGNKSFLEFLAEVKENALGAYEHQDYQFEELVDKLELPRDLSRNPLFDTVFALQNVDITALAIGELTFSPYEFANKIAKFDLTLEAIERNNRFEFTLEYYTKLFTQATVQRLAGHFVNVLKSIAAEPQIKLAEIEILSEDEQSQILVDFNNTEKAYPQDKTAAELFEEQAARTPANTAVVFEERYLTYRKLNEKANQLARVLKKKGVQANSIVGILVERSPEMIMGIMGILKAGGAYLPIDPEYPADRISYMLADSGAAICLTQRHLAGAISFTGETIDLADRSLYCGDSANLPRENTPQDLAYVIYTSGSTGKPKGVEIQHTSLANLIYWHRRVYEITPADRATQLAGQAFDASVWEIWPYLTAGAGIYIPNNETRTSPGALIQWLKRNRITISFMPTPLAEVLLNEEWPGDIPLRALLTGGDKLRRRPSGNLPFTLLNHYGPTENTVVATWAPVAHDAPQDVLPPIGRPVDNTKIYIVNSDNQLQPVGVPGELCIAGDSLAKGYLNRPELTAEKFVPNPFIPGTKMYRTGDLARWLPDGNIEFLGRIDHQVKIRGFRIELGEIEAELLKHPLIREAVVITKDDMSGNQYLCTYLAAEQELGIAELREHLAKELPEYMVPSYFVQLDKMPLTPNGKIDRKALPEPDTSINTGVEYTAPRNAVEEILVRVWQEVLKAERIGIRDNFFSLGGDSIKGIQVLSRLNHYGYHLEMRDLFKYPVIEELSSHVTLTSRQIDQGLVEGTVGLTPIQGWLFAQSFTDKHHFNQAVMLYAKTGFEEGALRSALAKLIEHHDALRMVVKNDDGHIVQFNRGLEGELYTLELVDVTNNDNYRDIITKEAERMQRSIDLYCGPLVKVGLFKTQVGDHMLIAIHHLVVDGVSWRIILQDFAAGYQQALQDAEIKLPDKTHSFKDWSGNLAGYANSRELLSEAAYWAGVEAADIKALPKDKKVTERLYRDNDSTRVEFTAEETEKLLKQANTAYNTEINDILLTALGLAVKEWGGVEKLLINLEGHGREAIIKDLDISRTVGWFTAQYPVVLDVGGDKDLAYRIKSVKENMRQIPNKGIGYGMLKYLTLPENKAALKFDLQPEISFNYLGQFDGELHTELFNMSDIPVENSVSLQMKNSYAIDISGMVTQGRLALNFTYNQGEYETATILRLTECFRKNLLDVISHCTAAHYTELTPSDISREELSLEDVENIYELLEDIYPHRN